MVERKSLYDISWKVDEPTYRADSAYSYSTISKFNREGFSKLESLFDRVETPSLLFGSLVDTLLTDGEDAFNKRFFVATFPPINQDFIPIVNAIKEELSDKHKSLTTISDSDIVGYLDRFDIYQNNWKPETKANKFRDNANGYYQMLLLCDGKTLVSSEMAQDARECVEVLRTHEATNWYFRKDNNFDGIERLYQLKFKGEYEGIKLKGMMDLAVIDHKNKLIIPCDLKTSYKPEYQFYKSFIEWNYFIQAQLYSELLKQNIAKDEYFKDFKILPYRFIVINNKLRNPKIWEFIHNFAITDVQIGDVKLPNWRGIVKQLDYYLKYNPKSPIGIEETKLNSIEEWIQKECM